jgi:hypothetical protein
MYLHLNLLGKERLFYIRTCAELKQDPRVGVFCPFPTFHTVALICRVFKSHIWFYSVEEECHLFLKPSKY